MASVASFFIQSGGQVFALIAVDRILVEAPPRSFALLQAVGYRDEVDLALQSRAARWYATDWSVWSVGLVCGLAQLLALIRPVTSPVLK